MYFHFCYRNFPIEAPTAVEISPKTTTSVTVKITAAEHNTDVSFFEAGYQRKICSVPSGASTLSCSLVDLSAGTRYRISAMACMADFECSHRRFGVGFTFPDGKYNACLCFRLLFNQSLIFQLSLRAKKHPN